MWRAIAIGAAFGVLMSGCGGGKSPNTGAEPAQAGVRPAVRRTGNLITEQELMESSARNGLQAVQLLRPDWVRGRGAASIRDVSPAAVIVYVDNQRIGGIDQLEQFTIQSIRSMRFYSASEATNRWGTGHGGGAIAVTTR